MKNEYFECACFSPQHRAVFQLDTGEEHKFAYEPELYMEAYLRSYYNIFKRVWVALKYVFGGKTKYGHFDCFLLKYEDAERLKELLNQYTTSVESWANKKAETYAKDTKNSN